MMNLEIDDYQRTLESLQGKLKAKERQFEDANYQIDRHEKNVEELKTQIG